MARSIAGAVRRSVRLIDKANGTTGPRRHRASSQLTGEAPEPTPPKSQASRQTTNRKVASDDVRTTHGTSQTSKKAHDCDGIEAKQAPAPAPKHKSTSGSGSKQMKSTTVENDSATRPQSKEASPKQKPANQPKSGAATETGSQPSSATAKPAASIAIADQKQSGEFKTRARATSRARTKGGGGVGDFVSGGLTSTVGKRTMPSEVADARRRVRAYKHRLFLVGRRDSDQDLADSNLSFIVMGTTGNIYYATLSPQTVRCTCIDQRIRKVFCKHILFVLLKVLKVPESHPIMSRNVAQITFTELNDIYQMSRDIQPDHAAIAPEGVRQAWQNATGQVPTLGKESSVAAPQREIAADDDCPICFEQLDDGERLLYCKSSCRRSVHAECFEKWAARKTKDREPVTCVYCRQLWETDVAVEDRNIKRKRLNLENFIDT